MPDTVSVTYIGGHDAVDIPDPSGSGRDIASDVKNGHSVEVPADVAKSLLEQSDNWKEHRPETPEQKAQREKRERDAAEERAAADKAAKAAIAKLRAARKENE